MRAIILAAGRGSRMGGLTDASPKCLVPLRGRSLLDRQLDALRGASVSRIAIITGWQAAQLGSRGTETFHNPRWANTNMVMSLACADAWLRGDICVVSYSDIFYTPDTVRALLRAPGDIAIAYDPAWLTLWSRRFADPLADAESFEIDPEGRVTDIGQRVSEISRIKGQYMGLLKFTPTGWTRVSNLLDSLSPDHRDRLDMTDLLRRLLTAGNEVHAVAVVGAWGEVDSASDLDLYERDLGSGTFKT